MKLSRISLVGMLIICCGILMAQKSNAQVCTSTPIRIIDGTLTDGTRIWGAIEEERIDTLVINDFNAGEICIDRSSFKECEVKELNGKVLIETVNGTSYYGEIISIKYRSVIIRSDVMGIFSLPSSSVSKISAYDAGMAVSGHAWFTNPNATRYFFAPSAIPLKKREGYFQNAYLLANSVNVGLTDNLTVGGGVVIPVLFYVTPKMSFRAAKNFYLGGGILFTQSFISEFGLSAGIAYGLATYGNYEHNITVGGGYGFAKFDKEYKQTPGPIVTVNGMSRIGKRLSLVTENWLIPRAGYDKEVSSTGPYGEPIMETVYQDRNFYSGAVSLGLRFMPGVKTSVDFAVVGIHMNPNQNDIALPYLDFVYKFN